MKLLRYEIKKAVIGKGAKGILLALIIVSAALGFIFAKSPPYDEKAVSEAVCEYRNDSDSFFDKYNELKREYEAYSKFFEAGIETDIPVPQSVIEYKQYTVALERINRQSDYVKKLNAAIRELSKNQSQESEKQKEINAYLAECYGRNKALRLGEHDIYGLENLFSMLAVLIFPLLTVCAFSGISVVFFDRRRGSELLLYSTKHGRSALSLAKIASCLICCIALCFVSITVAVTSFSLSSGFYAFSEYIQSSNTFALFPIPLTVTETIFILFGFASLSCILICVSVCLVSKYSKNPVFPFICGAGMILAFAFAEFGDLKVKGNILNICNPAKLCDGNRLFTHIYPVIAGDGVLYGMVVIALAYTVIMAVLVALFVFLGSGTYSYKPIYIPRKNHSQREKRAKTVLGYEYKKQLIANKTLVLICLALLLKCGVTVAGYSYEPIYTEQKYRSYITSIEGVYTTEKHEKLKADLSAARETMEQRDEMELLYRLGKLTKSEMGSYLARFYEAKQNEEALLKVSEKMDYLKTEYDKGLQPYILYDIGRNRLLSFGTDLILLVLIIGAMSGIYGDERKYKMNLLYAVCDRKALRKAKIRFCIEMTAFCFVLFTVVDIISVAVTYSLPFLPAPACSIEGTVLRSVPLWGYLLIINLAKCAGLCGFGLTVSLISHVTQNKVLAFTISLSAMLALLFLT